MTNPFHNSYTIPDQQIRVSNISNTILLSAPSA